MTADLPDVPDHYFTGEPATAAQRRVLNVRIAGHDVDVDVASGVFSPGRIDVGTQILLREVPPPPAAGHLLDLGCGWGPITLTLATLAPQATVWAVDVSERALDLTRRNAERLGLTNVRVCQPDDVPPDIEFAALWSNPPIRVGKQVLHAMLRTWLPRLARTPETGIGAAAHGAWLVVQKNLGADSLARWIRDDLGLDAERAATAKGFRVLHVTR